MSELSFAAFFSSLKGKKIIELLLLLQFSIMDFCISDYSDIWSVCDMPGVLSNMIPQYFADFIPTTSSFFVLFTMTFIN